MIRVSCGDLPHFVGLDTDRNLDQGHPRGTYPHYSSLDVTRNVDLSCSWVPYPYSWGAGIWIWAYFVSLDTAKTVGLGSSGDLAAPGQWICAILGA